MDVLGLLTLGVTALFVGLAVFVAVARRRFDRRVSEATEELRREPTRVSETPVTEVDLERLPEPIRRYLRFAGVVGRRRIARAHLTQSGRFRLGPDKRWMPFEARQHFTVCPPRFVWDASIEMMPALPFRVHDQYDGAESRMRGTLGGAIPVVDATGREIEQGSYMRYLGEGAWFPSVFLESYVSWEPIDETSARLTAETDDISVSAVCRVDEKGALREFTGERYFDRNGDATLETWYGHHDGYTDIEGFRLPTESTAGWRLDDGSFDYVEVSVEEVDFEFAGGG